MVNHKRRKRLLKLLAEHQTATVQQLVEWLNASPATVRRDISWLAARNLLTRTRGGAENLLPKKRQFPLSSETFQNNIQCYAARKRAIARHAAGMCTDGETIIINGGTTTFMMAEFLADKHLKILTNSFLMAERLLVSSENEIIVPGGKVYREQNVILSPFDNDITQHHYAGKMFMSVYGLSLLGLMEADPLLIQAEKRLISQAEELIVLADSSKFARKAGLILCGLDRVSTVITDTGASDKAVQTLEQYGVKVVTVEPDEVAPNVGAPFFNPQFDLQSAALFHLDAQLDPRLDAQLEAAH
ncbi:DeoR/GlpR transcriptional regulator [Massilia phosphatilytica]|jgi:DeoR family ulaG and ulaABCDEF operon transcriptional repressor|uniref:DeoR family transcriptional regulator n=1 Tax=Massilia cellulosiltytica TaxID=2683234 RepID=A0A7X3FXV4_9BURK|nr:MULTISPECIES: DeoR/GlpR family DNA-binding transcription regulator [Telluria group]KQZ44604.1 DeoR family transcriptional regulator [Massilia sp. Root1485]MVW59993.1 DeoR family transcriptional regulator [Telluria cellulosilytica]PQO99791.1 DeoR/GlpR transcriptional regulator [Massilia phosphatilytica]